MALTPVMRSVAEGIARDEMAAWKIHQEIDRAAFDGPWRYSPEEISEMWDEMTDFMEQVDARIYALRSVYNPWIVNEVIELAAAIFDRELS